ncbi:MAG TPA: allophanate hydrolase [Burkholderiales bacterium]|nr:allophanate hydrolase [Burkholderiales bacterium]
MSIDLTTLRTEFKSGRRTPTQEVERFLAQSGEPAWASAWIHRFDAERLRQRARALEEMARADPRAIERLPLYGVLFAAKDNIDAAGVPTTAACPAFAYTPRRSAAAIERLEAAGAILTGKTNLDQFATGLVGTRSPYGPVSNAFDPAYISGGSSSGSAVAVARGWVSFSLGTDTAGSGRVPAGLNNIVGLKPSRGLVSARGVVPACQSIDCVSVFALTVPDAVAVFDVLRGFDAEDPWSRSLALAPDTCPARFRFAIPDRLEFYGAEAARAAYRKALALLEALGGSPVEIDFAPLLEAASLLYEGPWVAERMAAIRPFAEAHADQMNEVVRNIIGGSAKYTAVQVYQAINKLEALKKATASLWERADTLVVPTSPTAYRIDEVMAEPYHTNRRLGYYTNFVNLLDMAALAVPVSMRSDGLPSGVTLIGRAGSDLALGDLGQRIHQASGLTLGATGAPMPAAQALGGRGDMVDVAVVGAHLTGQPLNYQLTERGGRLVRSARTAARYRLFALPNSTPPKPGLVRESEGHAIELEVWRLPAAAYGSFVALIRSPLGIGSIELEDGTWVQGFLGESWAVQGAEEISRFGGWRAWLASRAGK